MPPLLQTTFTSRFVDTIPAHVPAGGVAYGVGASAIPTVRRNEKLAQLLLMYDEYVVLKAFLSVSPTATSASSSVVLAGHINESNGAYVASDLSKFISKDGTVVLNFRTGSTTYPLRMTYDANKHYGGSPVDNQSLSVSGGTVTEFQQFHLVASASVSSYIEVRYTLLFRDSMRSDMIS